MLRDCDLTWTAFVVLWVVWVWGESETRHVAEEAGLVRRLPSPEDRRVALVEPTRQGRTAFLRAADVHARVVQRYFVDPLESGDYAG